MKNIFTILTTLLITSSVFAQAPQKMSYQAVVRDGSNELVTSYTVGMKISILQGSASGTTVYVETQDPTTNSNGLISLEIGNGTVVSGTFASINWSNGPYFIKTETDPAGGTNYSITGTNQLLSVPYALHAKTAESIASSYNIGDLYGGGVIFWVDKTGEHGLIVSMVDLSTSSQWSNIIDTKVGTNLWDGEGNSIAIINQNGHTSGAAQLCDEYTNNDYGTGTYSDWYLPSITELSLIDYHLYELNKTISNDGNSTTIEIKIGHSEDGKVNESRYWSSSEYSEKDVYYYDFLYRRRAAYSKGDTHRVRAIRAF